MNLLISVSGNGVSISEERGGQLNASQFVAKNIPGQTLRALLREYWGSPNTVLVHDSEFGTGYHSVTTHCSAGGHSWGYRLHPVMSEAESVECHNAMVSQAKAGVPVTAKSGLEIAFARIK